MDKSRILIINPTGFINNNANLSGIVEILCETGYLLDVVSRKRKISQISPCEGARILLYDDRILSSLSYFSFLKRISRYLNYMRLNNYNVHTYKFILGVDRDGIIEASYLSELMGIPYGLISYEIFFSDETSSKYKKEEIEACKGIDFAVCQDIVRSSFLATENHIPQDKIINIPVAGRGIRKGDKTQYLQNMLNIPFNKKIALFQGSFAKYSMIQELVQSTKDWPDEWVLVLHNRYGEYSDINKIIRNNHLKSIYISNELFETMEDMSVMLHSVDLGIALYNPIYSNRFDGNNLKYLGLSSGKISLYLQHGIPVLTNDAGLIGDYIRAYGAGYVIANIKEISSVLDSCTFNERIHEVCYDLFREKLDLNRHIESLLTLIKK